jgi:hypothetical protein
MYIYVTLSYPYFPVYHRFRWYSSDIVVYADAGFFDFE